jgi:intraflagellar transport protein 56
MTNDDAFNWNYGFSLAMVGQYDEAEEHFLLVEESEFLLDFCFISWICRCYIRNGKPEKAWEVYQQALDDSSSSSGEEELQLLLHMIANDCYQIGEFLFSARAFATLAAEQHMVLDAVTVEQVWKGLLGSCIGVFRKCIAVLQRHDHSKWDKVLSRCEYDMQEVVRILRASSDEKEVNQIVVTMMKWSSANGFRVEG